jgi:hypothetical protein
MGGAGWGSGDDDQLESPLECARLGFHQREVKKVSIERDALRRPFLFVQKFHQPTKEEQADDARTRKAAPGSKERGRPGLRTTHYAGHFLTEARTADGGFAMGNVPRKSDGRPETIPTGVLREGRGHLILETAALAVNNPALVEAMVATDMNRRMDFICRQVAPYLEAVGETGQELFDAPCKRECETGLGRVRILAEQGWNGWRAVASQLIFKPGAATTYLAHVSRRQIVMLVHGMVGWFAPQTTAMVIMGDEPIFLVPCAGAAPEKPTYRLKAGWDSVGVAVVFDVRPNAAIDDQRCEWDRPSEDMIVATAPPLWAWWGKKKSWCPETIEVGKYHHHLAA